MSQTIEKNSDVLAITAKLKTDLVTAGKTLQKGDDVSLCVIGKGNIRKVNCWFSYRKFPISFILNKDEFHACFEIRGVN